MWVQKRGWSFVRTWLQYAISLWPCEFPPNLLWISCTSQRHPGLIGCCKSTLVRREWIWTWNNIELVWTSSADSVIWKSHLHAVSFNQSDTLFSLKRHASISQHEWCGSTLHQILTFSRSKYFVSRGPILQGSILCLFCFLAHSPNWNISHQMATPWIVFFLTCCFRDEQQLDQDASTCTTFTGTKVIQFVPCNCDVCESRLSSSFWNHTLINWPQ